MLSFYAKRIREIAVSRGYPLCDPAVVEAWMRSGHPTLDGLSPEEFAHEVVMGCRCAEQSSESANAALAASFGLKTWEQADAVDAAQVRP